MRTDSHRLVGTLVALGFLAGWFSASWVSPPTAATQAGPARTAVAPPDVPMPRIALDAVRAPDTTPVTARNPFAFSGPRLAAPHAEARLARAVTDGAGSLAPDAPADAPVPVVPPAPAWHVFGIAADADGRYTAVVSGGGDVWLLAVGDRLPDGASVADIDATGLVLTTPDGSRLTLRLP
jgi:hypothetical protein